MNSILKFFAVVLMVGMSGVSASAQANTEDFVAGVIIGAVVNTHGSHRGYYQPQPQQIYYDNNHPHQQRQYYNPPPQQMYYGVRQNVRYVRRQHVQPVIYETREVCHVRGFYTEYGPVEETVCELVTVPVRRRVRYE